MDGRRLVDLADDGLKQRPDEYFQPKFTIDSNNLRDVAQ
jgi:hypothetical protein